MKKTILFAMLLNIGIAFNSYAANSVNQELNVNNTYLQLQELKYGKNLIPVGKVEAKISETVVLKPDTVQFSVTLLTDAATPNNASDLNVNIMKQFKDELLKLGLTEDNLETIGYQNNVRDINQENSQENSKYQANMNIVIKIDNNDSFVDLNKILDKYNINDIHQVKSDKVKNLYAFNIRETAQTLNNAKDNLYKKYSTITDELKKLQLTDFTITNSDTDKISPERITVKQYYVQHNLMVKTTKLDLIGKIIAKAQELKMVVNDDTYYTVSKEAVQKAVEEHEAILLAKLKNKVERLLAKQYLLGAPIQLDISGGEFDLHSEYNPSQRYAKRLYADGNMRADVNIYAPTEYKINLVLSGTFETLKPIQ